MPVDDFDGENGSSSGSDGRGQSITVPKLLSKLHDDYATDPESVVRGTPEKSSMSRKRFQVILKASGSLSATSFFECRLLLLSCSINHLGKKLCCAQKYSRFRHFRALRHNFSLYRVNPCLMSIIYPLPCFECAFLILSNSAHFL